MQDTDYTLSWILPFVRDALKEASNFTFDEFADAVWRILDNAGNTGVHQYSPNQMGLSGNIYNFEQSPHELRVAFTEALYYLISSGFIMPGVHTHVRGFPQQGRFYRTDRGAAWAAGGEPLPEDVDGYMKLLRRLVPKLDRVIEQYVIEGLRSYERGTLFASAVMIGAASEKGIYLLAESMRQAFKDPKQTATLEKLINGRGLNALFTFIQETLNKSSKVIPYGVTEGASAHLLSLMEAIRVQRNDAVHPQNARVSANLVRLSYQAFPHAIEMLENLREWLVANPNSI
jgi:hypothetical protein